MSLPPAFLDEIRARVPLSRVIGRRVAWDLRRSNQARGDWWAPCPFHHEKTASFHVDDQKGFYYCFGCLAKGDAIGFLREAEGMGFMEAVAALAAEAGMALPERTPEAKAQTDRRTQLVEVMEQAVRWFRLQLQTAAAGAARDYLAGRGLDSATLDRFEIGFAPDNRRALAEAMAQKGIAAELLDAAGLVIRPDDGGNPYDRFRGRIIFPIRDARGRAIAFGGRAMDPGARAKYLNSPETALFDKGRTLYNLGPARVAVGKGAPLVVAEGYMDVIALARAGFEGAVAPLGTAITEEQLRLMWRVSPEPVVALDGDAAGLRAAMRLVDLALPLTGPGQALRFALMPPGQDPDDLIRGQGRAAMQAVLDGARPLVDLLWQRETEGRQFDSPERRAALDHALRAAIARIPDPATRAHTEAEIRARRAALFRPEAPARPSGPGPRRFGKPGPEAPRAQTRASRLAAGDEGERLLEAAVLAACARHPEIVAALESRLERLVPADPGRAALLHDLLAGSRSEAGAAALDALLADPHLRLVPPSQQDDPDHAARIVENALDRIEARRASRVERHRLEDEIVAGAADEGLTWRAAQLTRVREAADRPNLGEAGDLGEDPEALVAGIDALLEAVQSGSLGRRGRR
ncbi:DNA primase [Paracoccus sp. S-4012]|uniref:DNA primase n=1 Tax=Paracoccus sp. S-4012 TaxID=2665648 RepID=UPI0012B1164A|nr:DNA primase [Paracoccus sp. S-4012]MRX50731.1 DNA primase [Paracoccus sp. S-4012]